MRWKKWKFIFWAISPPSPFRRTGSRTGLTIGGGGGGVNVGEGSKGNGLVARRLQLGAEQHRISPALPADTQRSVIHAILSKV